MQPCHHSLRYCISNTITLLLVLIFCVKKIDIKSHNVLLDSKWNARISDFGITKLAKFKSGNQEKREALGTVSITLQFSKKCLLTE